METPELRKCFVQSLEVVFQIGHRGTWMDRYSVCATDDPQTWGPTAGGPDSELTAASTFFTGISSCVTADSSCLHHEGFSLERF